MKLVASLVVRNELGRYLDLCLDHLLGYCDAVAVVDDGSDDGTFEYLLERAADDERLRLDRYGPRSTFYEHEGRTRQRLLAWTLAQEPTHVLAIDADEFVAELELVRSKCEMGGPIWTLDMEEVWELDGDCLCVREDGGWRSHPVAILWATSAMGEGDQWRIANRALACGRVPVAVQTARRPPPTGTQVLHFGWTNEAERVARHERYAIADGGRYHRSAHLDSILWTDERVRLRARAWPASLPRDELGARVAGRRRLEAK